MCFLVWKIDTLKFLTTFYRFLQKTHFDENIYIHKFQPGISRSRFTETAKHRLFGLLTKQHRKTPTTHNQTPHISDKSLKCVFWCGRYTRRNLSFYILQMSAKTHILMKIYTSIYTNFNLECTEVDLRRTRNTDYLVC